MRSTSRRHVSSFAYFLALDSQRRCRWHPTCCCCCQFHSLPPGTRTGLCRRQLAYCRSDRFSRARIVVRRWLLWWWFTLVVLLLLHHLALLRFRPFRSYWEGGQKGRSRLQPPCGLHRHHHARVLHCLLQERPPWRCSMPCRFRKTITSDKTAADTTTPDARAAPGSLRRRGCSVWSPIHPVFMTTRCWGAAATAVDASWNIWGTFGDETATVPIFPPGLGLAER